MTRAYRPVTPADLTALLVSRVDAAAAPRGIVRVAIDGPACADPADLARTLVDPLRVLGRETHVVAAETFWKDAALRLEHGHEDADAYLDWLDAGALRREVLDPLGAGGDGRFLPSLRDPSTNRSTRAEPVAVAPGGAVIVAGGFLLGLGLPFEVVVHLAVSRGARQRGTPAQQAWTLAALNRYDGEVDPAALADVVVRYDDPGHPAVALG